MSARQHLLTDDDLAGVLAEVDSLRDWVRDLTATGRDHERTIRDLRRELAQRYPTVPAASILDEHPADLIPR